MSLSVRIVNMNLSFVAELERANRSAVEELTYDYFPGFSITPISSTLKEDLKSLPNLRFLTSVVAFEIT